MKLSTLRPLYEDQGSDLHSKFTEYYDIDPDKAFGYLYDFIESNCGPYLSDRGGMMSAVVGLALYRGMKGKKSIEILAPRTDRAPRDTPLPIHKAFIEAIKESGGIANRDNSFFTTEVHSQAAGFGEAFIALPIGRYHSTYLRGVGDLTLRYPNWFRDADFPDHVRDEANVSLFTFLEFLERPESIKHHPYAKPKALDKLEQEMNELLMNHVRDLIVVDDLSDDLDDEEVLIAADNVLFISSEFTLGMHEEFLNYIKKREGSK